VKAIIISSYGGPEVLDPVPAAGEVLMPRRRNEVTCR
jgi:hypothetical protein